MLWHLSQVVPTQVQMVIKDQCPLKCRYVLQNLFPGNHWGPEFIPEFHLLFLPTFQDRQMLLM